ncbi:MAG: hypothetical protein RMN51_12215 [Verrucomicrobiota bacterium]|nr:hypothetical protein [Limisphaera sp.]MDW8382856.1 hypothetical protein [Verrucomicrobiota bacterium]
MKKVPGLHRFEAARCVHVACQFAAVRRVVPVIAADQPGSTQCLDWHSFRANGME